jgi:L-lactate dehydrogenase complex protein LldF
VLVDDGRSALAARPAFSPSLSCIRCGACLNTCPVFRRSGGHSYETSVAGPIGSILAPARDPERYRSLPLACSLCGSCTDVCPVRIDLHHQLLSWRGVLARKRLLGDGKRRAMQLAAFVLARPRLYERLARFARSVARALPSGLAERLGGVSADRRLPEPPRESFREELARRRSRGRG